jgi:hypothetical protein
MLLTRIDWQTWIRETWKYYLCLCWNVRFLITCDSCIRQERTLLCIYLLSSHDCSVSLVTSHWLGDRGIWVRWTAGTEIFLFSTAFITALGLTKMQSNFIATEGKCTKYNILQIYYYNFIYIIILFKIGREGWGRKGLQRLLRKHLRPLFRASWSNSRVTLHIVNGAKNMSNKIYKKYFN